MGLLAVPIVRQLAIAVGMVDRPDAHRKIHSREVAVGGGVAVFLTIVIVLYLFAFLSDTWWNRAGQRTVEFLGLGVAAALICVIGIWDDWKGLGGKKKLLGQTLAGILVLISGPPINDISLFGFELHLGVFTYPFALVWILAAINSVNLIDGMDGLCSSVGASMMASLAIIGLWTGHAAEAIVALAAAGALFAFLVYNFFPASIFLGDTGSMLVGLLSGSLLLRVSSSPEGVISAAVPIAVMTIPLFDTTAAVIRRKFAGRSIYTTDRGHIHHCFRRKGMNVRWTMSCIALLSVMAGLGSIAAAVTGRDEFALLGSLLVVGILAGSRSFGDKEIELLALWIKTFVMSFVAPTVRGASDHDLRVQLQGEGNWEELWDELKATAQRLGLTRVRLDVNLPAMHEGYYAEWKSRVKRSDEAAWQAIVPLVVNNRPIGRVELAGDRSESPSVHNGLSLVGELLDAVELRVAYLVQTRAAAHAKPVVVHLADSAVGHAPKMPSKLANSNEVMPTAS